MRFCQALKSPKLDLRRILMHISKTFLPFAEIPEKMKNFLLNCVVFCGLHAAFAIHNIHWNSTNPLFSPSSQNIIQVNSGNYPLDYDQVNLICPFYRQNTNQNAQEKYIIYAVSQDEYESCRISHSNPRIIAVCDKPHELKYFTITFRSFTPTPGGLEFRPGQSYYFISTSSKTDIHRRVGGFCSTHNMKITFKVAEAKPILTIEENNLEEQREIPKMSKTQKPATLYYPLHEMEKEFLFKRKQRNMMFNHSVLNMSNFVLILTLFLSVLSL